MINRVRILCAILKKEKKYLKRQDLEKFREGRDLDVKCKKIEADLLMT